MIKFWSAYLLAWFTVLGLVAGFFYTVQYLRGAL